MTLKQNSRILSLIGTIVFSSVLPVVAFSQDINIKPEADGSVVLGGNVQVSEISSTGVNSNGVCYDAVNGQLTNCDTSMVGPTGPEGPAGSEGPEGAAGADGDDGTVGSQGPAGPAGADGEDGAVGSQGSTGPAGADGAAGPAGPAGSSAYGTALAGDLTITTNTAWNTYPGFPFSFGNLTINSGVTLTVPSGSIIRRSGQFTNNGTISANGGDGYTIDANSGAGGGGGGFVVLASAGNIANGTISATGGTGAQAGPNDDDGGGGGGVVHLLGANASSVAGTINVTGGLAGANRAGGGGSAGGGGGAFGGNGGAGGGLFGTGGNASDGSTGLVFRSQVTDPASLF